MEHITTIVTSRRKALHALFALALAPAATLLPQMARAHGAGASAASSLSLAFPVAVLSVAPVAILGSGVALTVIAIEATAGGTAWLLRRASDGATASLRFSGQAAPSLPAPCSLSQWSPPAGCSRRPAK